MSKKSLRKGCQCSSCELLPQCSTHVNNIQEMKTRALTRTQQVQQLPEQQQAQEVQNILSDLEQDLKGEVEAMKANSSPLPNIAGLIANQLVNEAVSNWLKKQGLGSLSNRRRKKFSLF